MNTIGRARIVSTEVKAAYLCGLFAGSNWSNSAKVKKFRNENRHVAFVAASIAFGEGVFSP